MPPTSTGTGGSSYTKYNYPGLYSSPDFDNCTSQITDYRNRANVQNCVPGGPLKQPTS